VITAGQRGDSPQFVPVLAGIRAPRIGGGRPRTRPDRVLADKADTTRANRGYLRRHGIKATIPSKSDQDAHRRAKGSAGQCCNPSKLRAGAGHSSRVSHDRYFLERVTDQQHAISVVGGGTSREGGWVPGPQERERSGSGG
jgi:Transposase DDE domain